MATRDIRRFEHRDGGHNKFWEGEIVYDKGTEEYKLYTRWGKIGTSNPTMKVYQYTIKAFAIKQRDSFAKRRLNHHYDEVYTPLSQPSYKSSGYTVPADLPPAEHMQAGGAGFRTVPRPEPPKSDDILDTGRFYDLDLRDAEETEV